MTMTKCECGEGLLTDGEREDGICQECFHLAYNAQCKNLRLKPWDEPVCVVDSHEAVRRTAHEAQMMALLRMMLKLGISRFDHDPLAAVAKAKRRKER